MYAFVLRLLGSCFAAWQLSGFAVLWFWCFVMLQLWKFKAVADAVRARGGGWCGELFPVCMAGAATWLPTTTVGLTKLVARGACARSVWQLMWSNAAEMVMPIRLPEDMSSVPGYERERYVEALCQSTMLARPWIVWDLGVGRDWLSRPRQMA
jgi:hypothetical protein